MARRGISDSKIAIWRDEVNASQKYCVCSEPSLIPAPISPIEPSRTVDPSDYPKPRPPQCLSPLPASSIPPTTWAKCSYVLDLKEPSPELNPSLSISIFDDSPNAQSFIVSILSSDVPVMCSTCGEPFDPEMVEARFKKRGWASPKAPPKYDESVAFAFDESPRSSRSSWLSRFKNHQDRAEAVRKFKEKIEREKSIAASENEKSPAKRTIKSSVSKLFKSMKPPPLSDVDTTNPSRETAMYGTYSFASSTDLGKTSIDWLPSDSEGGRPKPNIDSAVARLYRAQKLLEKTTHDNSRLRHTTIAPSD
ncbi:hypothetical protein F4821DRAFT_221238 [Hypoxylon rubiginosum]|uniref:Uncharacterized protein n=1 Tax=Hypoxylon rubiginosum TaxID=110542 RepID=A0ACC0DMX0_9PEZI|nr:hypothetical protein F4821DRAFT_221238 [Hypoxylon rubiginosum]